MQDRYTWFGRRCIRRCIRRPRARQIDSVRYKLYRNQQAYVTCQTGITQDQDFKKSCMAKTRAARKTNNCFVREAVRSLTNRSQLCAVSVLLVINWFAIFFRSLDQTKMTIAITTDQPAGTPLRVYCVDRLDPLYRRSSDRGFCTKRITVSHKFVKPPANLFAIQLSF